jgi:hypothetical protein
VFRLCDRAATLTVHVLSTVFAVLVLGLFVELQQKQVKVITTFAVTSAGHLMWAKMHGLYRDL